MSDHTGELFIQRLGEVRGEIQRLRARIARANDRLAELVAQEKTLTDALRMVGAEVPEPRPEQIAEAGAKRRHDGRLRVIDAVLQVVEAGERISKHVTAKRIEDAGINLQSKNLVNAVGTAMHRSPQFKNLGAGQFERLLSFEPEKQASKDDEIPY